MASNLKAVFAYTGMPTALEGIKALTNSLLSNKYGGSFSRNTAASHFNPALKSWKLEGAVDARLPEANYERLKASANCRPPLSRTLYNCTAVSLGNFRYQPETRSRHNSHIMYGCQTTGCADLHVGTIRAVFAEKDVSEEHGYESNRIFLLVGRYDQLEEDDEGFDPYAQHPLVGKSGYDFVRMCYNRCSIIDVIPVSGIVSHVSVCPYNDATHNFLHDAIVTVVLDRVRSFIAIFAHKLTHRVLQDYVGSRECSGTPTSLPTAPDPPIKYDDKGYPIQDMTHSHTESVTGSQASEPEDYLMEDMSSRATTPRPSAQRLLSENLTPHSTIPPSFDVHPPPPPSDSSLSDYNYQQQQLMVAGAAPPGLGDFGCRTSFPAPFGSLPYPPSFAPIDQAPSEGSWFSDQQGYVHGYDQMGQPLPQALPSIGLSWAPLVPPAPAISPQIVPRRAEQGEFRSPRQRSRLIECLVFDGSESMLDARRQAEGSRRQRSSRNGPSGSGPP